MGDELTHPLANFKGATVRVSESFHTFNGRNYKTTRIFYGINNTMLCTWYNNSHGNITVESRQLYGLSSQTWWRHLMEIISTLLAFCAGNSPVTGDLRRHRDHYDVTVMKRFDCFNRLFRLTAKISKFRITDSFGLVPSKRQVVTCNNDNNPVHWSTHHQGPL